jgi:aryl-alcohol dehydrogenase-like predicted oxidoreductase
MEYRSLGHSGLKVSTLTLGTMTFGGQGFFAKAGNTDLAGARRQIDRCIAAGINLFDTADIYSAGVSEEMVGQALEQRRHEVLIATKARFTMGPSPNDCGTSRYHLIRACEASLKRLRTDYIDLYQLHEWDGQTPLEETLEALDRLERSGKIRYAGVSNFSGWHLMKALAVAERHGYVRPVAQQIHYTLQAREAEYELLPITLDQGLGVLVWSPLAGGLLSGKYRRGKPQPAGTRQAAQWNEPPVRDSEALYDIVEVLLTVAQEHDATASQVALAWLLTRPGIASVIIGARTDEQLEDNLRAAELKLVPGDLERLERVSRPPLLYPYWHQKATAADRLSAADRALLGPYLTE